MTTPTLQDDFVYSLHALAEKVYEQTSAKGFWDDRLLVAENLGERGILFSDMEMINLIHSELSEVTEALRIGNPQSSKLPGFTQVEEEMADVVIRILDFTRGRRLRLAKAILAKMEYNKQRFHKHGKRA